MDVDWSSVRSPMLSLNSLTRAVGEAVPTLYPSTFIYLRSSIIRMVLWSSWLSEMYSLSVKLRYISVWSCEFCLTGHPKYDTKNPKQYCAVYESSIVSSGNQLPLKPVSDHTLMSLLQGQIYLSSFSVHFRYYSILLTVSPCGFLVYSDIMRIDAPCIQCLVEYYFPGS